MTVYRPQAATAVHSDKIDDGDFENGDNNYDDGDNNGDGGNADHIFDVYLRFVPFRFKLVFKLGQLTLFS